MEAALKRIGDVTIERVPTEKKSKNDEEEPLSSAMNSDDDFGTDSHSSDDELISDPPHTSLDEKSPANQSTIHPKPSKSSDTHHEPFDDTTDILNPLTSAKRKQNFDLLDPTLKTSKKTKSTADLQQLGASCSKITDIVRKTDDLSDLFDDPDHLGEVKLRTRLESDNEDSEYDSEEDSELDEPMRSGLVKLEPGASLPGTPQPDLDETEKADFIEKFAGELGESSQKSDDGKLDGSDYDYDITEKLKEMGEISVETVKKGEKSRKSESVDGTENEISVTPAKKDNSGSDSDDKNSSERKIGNMRRNIREVMDETQLDEATLAAQRQEMERLRRVQEQQRIIREVQRQIALNRQNNKTQHRVISLLQGNSSIIKQMPGTSGSTPNRIGGTVLVKLPNGETKPMTRITKGQTPFEVVRLQKGTIQGKVQRNLIPVKKSATGNLTPSVSIAPVAKPKIEPKTASDDSESEPSDTEKKVRKVAGKPKDVVTISSSSDDDCIVLSEDEPDEPEPDEDPCNSGMHTNDAYNVPDEQGRVLINVGHPEDEAEVFLAPQIARVIKPHQIGGVRFLFDNVIESTGRFSTSTGFGCILAHSMGLGKTLQVVCFSDIFLRHTPAKTILCIMPINTLQNWMAEYNMWLPKDTANSPLLSHGEVRPRNFNIYVLNDSHKTLNARAKVIQEWNREGGVLLIGYELYRLLSLRRNPKPKSKRKKLNAVLVDRPDTPEDDEKTKTMYDEIHEALVKPGPDLVICDEGHRIKNSHASISHALKQIRSKRRIVLTGYPLQNNLLEYWCMVDFVRPNYLGTKTEFSNMFERPIQNGQCIDSTPQDIRLMRYRAHVLHSLLEGFVQRRSHAVLQTSLPQKEEYVLLVRMTEFQRKLYDTFMNEVVRTKTVPNPLKAFAVCCKIWNHPDVLYYFLKKHNTGDAVDIDLEEVANAAALTAANGGVPVPPATPKKASRSRGGAKKERKTAASKTANANIVKPAASVTPSTNTPTPSSTTTTNAPNTPLPPPNPPLNIPNPNNNAIMQQNMPPMMQNYPNPQQQQPAPPNPNYQQPPAPYPNYQNFPQYNQNGEYYNQQQQQPNYPNNYNTGYYPNPEYGAFYDGAKPENYQQGYQQDGQNYWQQPQQNYNYQNPAQNDYYANMNQQSGYNNQEYYRQNPYNQNYQNYQQNNPQYPQNQQWPQGQQNFDKPELKTEQNEQKAELIKSETSDSNQMHIDAKMDKKPELDSDKCEITKHEMEDDKKIDVATELGEIKENLDEKIDKDGDLKTAEITTVSKPIKEDPGIPYDWALEFMKGYIPGCIENSAKMEIFFCILQESMALGDRILLFSQSLFTLNLIEEFLQKNEVPGNGDKWAKNKNYYRLDGSTSALEREKLINEYNSNPNIHLFLVSTRAGSLGINLVGANRVIVFDASWNPCHDTQAVCRVYRYGQKKPCFVYRIVMDNCLEKKIYDRQINKQGMADRVVDECNPDAHLSMKDVTNLCWDDEKDSEVKDFSTTKDKYIDVVMQKVLDAYSSRLSKEPFQHESLLIDRKEKKLSQAEKRLAKRSYELEKQANINSRPTYSYYNNGSGQGLQIRAIRTQDGMMQNKPVASVRPMQSEQMNLNRAAGAAGQQGRSRWIPAEVWQRQGMTAQEMTLPLDVVIPTNSPDRGSIVLKAGQKVLVLKSPKGIYMQLECGKIVAIKTAFKVRGGKAADKGEEGANKDNAPTTILKKLPQTGNNSKSGAGNLPMPLKNNSAITVIPKGGQQRVIKPFAQGVTKLNMRSIRQPVPNLISRQMNMRIPGGPRFTGKIQSIHRKVQLAKAKPYNLDKSGEASPPKPVDSNLVKSEPRDPDAETHVVPSSDEEIPAELQQELAEKKDDDSTDNERFPPNDMFSESERSMEPADMEPSSVEYPENSGDRRPSTESYQSSEKLSSSDSFTNLDQFSNTSEHFSTSTDTYRQTERIGGVDKYPERFSSIERIANTSERFQNQPDRFQTPEKNVQSERFSNQPERFQTPEKVTNQIEQYHTSEQQPERLPNQPERFNNPDKFLIQPVKLANQPVGTEKFPAATERLANQPERFGNPDKIQNQPEHTPNQPEHIPNQPERCQNPEKFPKQPERFQSTDKFPNQPERFESTDKFPNQPHRFQSTDKFSNQSERFQSTDKFPNQPERFQSTEKFPNQPERFQATEKFPNQHDRFQSTEKFPNQPDRFQSTEKFSNQSERFQSTDKFPNQPERFQSTEKFPNQAERFQGTDKFPNLPERFSTTDKFPNQPERFQSTDKFSNQPERFQSTEKFPNQPEIFQSTDKLPNQSERFQSTEKFPKQPERFQSTDKFPNQPERFQSTDKFPNQSERFQITDKFPNQSERFQSSDKFPNQPERFQSSDKFPNQPERFQSNEKFANQLDRFSNQPERFQNQEKYQNQPDRFQPTESQSDNYPERYPTSERYPEKYPNAAEAYQTTEKITERFPEQQKFPESQKFAEKCPNIFAERFPIAEKFPSAIESYQVPEKHPKEKIQVLKIEKFPNPDRFPLASGLSEKFPNFEKQFTNIPENKYPAAPERTYQQLPEKQFTAAPIERAYSQAPEKTFIGPVNPENKYPQASQNADKLQPVPERQYTQIPERTYPEKYPHETKFPPVSERYPQTPDVKYQNLSVSENKYPTPERSYQNSEVKYPEYPPELKYTQSEAQFPTPERLYPQNPAPERQYPVNPEKTYQPLNVPNPEKNAPERAFAQTSERTYTTTPERQFQVPEKGAIADKYAQIDQKYQIPERYPQQFANKFANPVSYENLDRFGSDISETLKSVPVKEKAIEKIEKGQKAGNFGGGQQNVEPATKRSLKNYRHNFAGQKAGNFATKPKVAATSSALHQLEQTTVSIGENKQPFQESLDIITNSYGAVPPDGKTGEEGAHIIDLDAEKATSDPPEKPTKSGPKSSQQPASHTITSDSNSSTSSSSKPPQVLTQPQQPSPNIKPETIPSSQPTAQAQDYGYNTYYGASYNPAHNMQPYPNPPAAQPVPAAPAVAPPPTIAPPPATGPPPQTYYPPAEAAHYPEVKAKPETKPAQPPVATPASAQSRSETTPVAEPTTSVPTHHAAGYAPAPTGFTPYGSYDMMNYPQQNQYAANYPGIPYPNQPNYQPPYQAPPQYDQPPYGAPPPTAANMYSAFHRPDMHQYPPADPYAQSHYAMRNAYPPQYPPYPNPAGQYAPPGPGAGPPPPGYDYQYNAAAAAAAGFPPPPVGYPYSGLPNNNPVP